MLCVVCRAKTARVITFEQFNQALVELAPKRFRGKDQQEALPLLYGLIAGKGPANVGVTVSGSGKSTRQCGLLPVARELPSFLCVMGFSLPL